jgi:hypothetical protein
MCRACIHELWLSQARCSKCFNQCGKQPPPILLQTAIITGHYIDVLVDKPHDWKLKMEQLAFKNVKGQHLDKNIADILVETIDHYSICGKVQFTFQFNEMQSR